ncbi:MAG: hypothetical protein AAFP19_00005, partial [Bacteroidota bacterium]
MITKFNTLLFLLFVFPYLLYAQDEPIGATINANRVKATINSNGALFWDFDKGQFIFPSQGGNEDLSTIRAAGLWMGGRTAAGFWKGAIQVYNENGKADFFPGHYDRFNNEPFELNGVWRIPKIDVEKHIDDFLDNGVIDDPLPSIYAWPARGNPYFEEFNDGQTLPNTTAGLAPFKDANGDNQYNPDDGDHPNVFTRGCDQDIELPTEMLWTIYTDAATHTQSQLLAMDVEVQTQVLIYGCEENDHPLNNTVIVYNKIIHNGPVSLDSTYMGIFTDFDIGNPNDDFVGTIPNRWTAYAYNGDDDDENAYGSNSPVMAMDIFRGPFNEMGDLVTDVKFMLVDNPSNLTGPEYLELLKGKDLNGNLLPNQLYPDDPNDPNGDSEVSAGNTPGDRKVLASMGPFRLDPGAVNEFIVAYSALQNSDNTILQNVSALTDHVDQVQAFYDSCYDTESNNCSSILVSDSAPTP